MQKYKILVSKQGKNFTFVLSAENENQARERIHKEGYSILNIEEISDNTKFGHEFIFEAEKNGTIKKGKVIGTDIFKVYIKLRKNLGYNVYYLFEENKNGINEEEKKEIIKELEEEYEIYINNNLKEEKKEIKEEIKEKKNIADSNYDNEKFYLKKNLDETYKLIDFILEKLKNIIDGKDVYELNAEEKEKFKNIYYSIVKIKKTTNILKLKEIGEKALLKIGEKELKFLELNKTKDAIGLLNQTNGLLKKIGSSKQVSDNKYSIESYIKIFKDYIFENINKRQKLLENIKNNKIDQESYYFIKNQLLLNKYKEKLKINKKEIIKNFFNNSKRTDLLLKNRVIKQNIIILKAKVNGIGFSYTLLKKGYNNILNNILILFTNIRKNIFNIILIYTLFFIFFINFNQYLNINYFNYNGIKYIIFIILLYFILYISKNMITIIISFIIYYLLILFFIINF